MRRGKGPRPLGRGRPDDVEGFLEEVETVGFRAGIDTEGAAIALRKVQHHRDKPRFGVYLGARRQAVLDAGPDAPPTTLAIRGYDERLGSSGHYGHGTTSYNDAAVNATSTSRALRRGP